MTDERVQSHDSAIDRQSWLWIYWSVLLFAIVVMILLWSFSWFFTPSPEAANSARIVDFYRAPSSCT